MHSVLRLSSVKTFPLACRPLVSAESWEAGSPKLRINTQKRSKQREQASSDGPPADFYSPVSSFQESPNSSGQPPLSLRTKLKTGRDLLDSA